MPQLVPPPLRIPLPTTMPSVGRLFRLIPIAHSLPIFGTSNCSPPPHHHTSLHQANLGHRLHLGWGESFQPPWTTVSWVGPSKTCADHHEMPSRKMPVKDPTMKDTTNQEEHLVGVKQIVRFPGAYCSATNVGNGQRRNLPSNDKQRQAQLCKNGLFSSQRLSDSCTSKRRTVSTQLHASPSKVHDMYS